MRTAHLGDTVDEGRGTAAAPSKVVSTLVCALPGGGAAEVGVLAGSAGAAGGACWGAPCQERIEIGLLVSLLSASAIEWIRRRGLASANASNKQDWTAGGM